MKNSIGHALIFGICSDRNKRKQGSEIKELLMPCGAEVGLNNTREVVQEASLRSAQITFKPSASTWR
jgi:hypothetical protein